MQMYSIRLTKTTNRAEAPDDEQLVSCELLTLSPVQLFNIIFCEVAGLDLALGLDAITDALIYQSQFAGIYCNSFIPANCTVTTIITF